MITIRFLPMAVVAAAIAFANSSSVGDDDDGPAIAAKTRPGVALLKGYRDGRSIIGTGFLLNDHVLITNAHVVTAAKTMVAEFDNGEKIDCSIIDTNNQLDLAALALNRPMEKRALSRQKEVKVAQGEKVFLMGNPLELQWSFQPGAVAAIRTVAEIAKAFGLPEPSNPHQKVYQLAVQSTFGMSGAPVLNRAGDVIGIQKEGWGDGLGGINFCIPQELLDLLDLTKEPSSFPGGVTLNSNFQSVGLQKQNLERPQLKVDGREVDIGCDHWGFVEQNADVVFAKYIGDKERFGSIMPKNVVQDILHRHRVVHVTNSAFGVSFLTPDNYELSQVPQTNPQGLIIRLTNRDQSVPAGFREIRIYASRTSKAGDASFRSEQVKSIIDSFAKDQLNLKVHSSFESPPPSPTWQDVAMVPAFSDPAPRAAATLPLTRYHVIYNTTPFFNTSWSIYASIAGETVTVVAYPFRTMLPIHGVAPDAAERQFIAETVSFDLLNRASTAEVKKGEGQL